VLPYGARAVSSARKPLPTMMPRARLSTVEKKCGSVGAVLRPNHAGTDHFPNPENEKPAG
jgi:hypothetical protein